MRALVYFAVLQVCRYVSPEIKGSVILNKLQNVKPVGRQLAHRFIPLTEIPPPRVPHQHPNGRRHLDPDEPQAQVVYVGPKVEIFGEYYDDKITKTVATVVIPDHIDRKHFEVTSQVPYLTVGPIEALGYHPSTIKSEHPSECEKIYQDHLDDQYSEEDLKRRDTDFSEESLEMARMPLVSKNEPSPSVEERLERMYGDLEA